MSQGVVVTLICYKHLNDGDHEPGNAARPFGVDDGDGIWVGPPAPYGVSTAATRGRTSYAQSSKLN